MINFTTSYQLASDFINNNPAWVSYWREPIQLFKSFGWEVIPFTKKDWMNLKAEAYTSYKNNNFFILYCVENYSTRISYNFHHECGHIIAAHPIRFRHILCKSSKSTEKLYLEQSATVIGRNVFLPAYIIKHIIKYAYNINIEIVKKYFCETYNLSTSYINARFDFLEEDFRNMKYPKEIYGEACKEYGFFANWYIKKYGINIKNSYLP